jgi:erythromycin esterase
MLTPLLLLAAAFALQPQGEQDRLADLRTLAIPINSIDPHNEHFEDLQPLKRAIGDARVVQLGEQSHGDGACFLAKCRLVKFLHQEMGFDVLVFESGYFDLSRADRAIQDRDIPLLDATWKEGVFGIWALSAQCQPVLQYARDTAATDRRLEIAGYDCQFSSGRPERWLDELQTFFKPLGDNHPTTHIIAAIHREKGTLSGEKMEPRALEGVIQGLENLTHLTDASSETLANAHGEADFTLFRRSIDDALATARMSLGMLRSRHGLEALTNYRDLRMGENLVYLANERYKGRRLIVWAATMHEVHDVEAIRPGFNPDFYKGHVSAGTEAKRILGDDLYTIAFDAHEGSAGVCFGPSRPLEKSPAGSLGAMLAEIDHPFLFVELRSLPDEHWLRGPVVMRPLGYLAMDADWPRQFDAVFFTREMFASTRTGMAPQGAVLTVQE